MLSRRAFRARRGSRDANHAAIRDALRKLGYLVIDLAGAGDGVPDLLVFGRTGRVVFLELKTFKGKPRPSQERFAAQLATYDVTHAYVRTLDEALAVLSPNWRATAEANGKRTHETIEAALVALNGGGG